MKDFISIVIPAHNEEKSIQETLEKISGVMKKTEFPFEIITINDGSTDNTEKILEKISGIKVVKNAVNKGYGASLKIGIKKAEGNWIFIIDADGSYPVKSIPEFLKHMGSYDLITGARVGTYKPFYGKPAKWFLNKFAGYLTNSKVLDLNCGMRLFKKECALDFFNILPDKFSFTSTQMMACLSNSYNVKFIPIEYYKRKGKSKLKPIKSFFEFIMLLTRMSVYFNPLKIFLRLSFALFLASAAVLLYSAAYLEKILDTTITILFISSVQMLILGMIAELIVKSRK